MTFDNTYTPVPAPPAQPRLLTLVTASRQPPLEERWTNGFAFQPEGCNAGSVRDACDMGAVQLARPAAPTATPSTSGGTLADGSTYQYQVTAVNAYGQSIPSASSTAATVVGPTGSVALTTPAVTGAAHYDWYGRASGSLLLLGTTVSPAFTDTGAAATGGAPPSSDSSTGAWPTYANPAQVRTMPFVIGVEDRCSAFGFDAHDYAGRVGRLLDAVTPKRLENEFWTGTLATAKGWENLYLASNTATDLTPGSLPSRVRGLEILEQGLADCGYGGRGMIHLQPENVPSTGYVRRVGNLMLTNLDTVVVPGVGYPGTGPDGNAPAAGTTWMYATGLVDVRLGEPVLPVDPAADPDWRGKVLDRSTNLIVLRAERYAAATWDGCCHLAVRINLDT